MSYLKLKLLGSSINSFCVIQTHHFIGDQGRRIAVLQEKGFYELIDRLVMKVLRLILMVGSMVVLDVWVGG